jgi:hypothetical protein
VKLTEWLAIALETASGRNAIRRMSAAPESALVESYAGEHPRDPFGVDRLAVVRSAGDGDLARREAEMVRRAARDDGQGLKRLYSRSGRSDEAGVAEPRPDLPVRVCGDDDAPVKGFDYIATPDLNQYSSLFAHGRILLYSSANESSIASLDADEPGYRPVFAPAEALDDYHLFGPAERSVSLAVLDDLPGEGVTDARQLDKLFRPGRIQIEAGPRGLLFLPRFMSYLFT